MCVVSIIGDTFNEYWHNKPWIKPTTNPDGSQGYSFSIVSREEFEALKKEVELLKVLLTKAAAYDKANGEPHCEKPEKIKLLKDIAKALGVELDGI
jgi:hypothetical protein